MKQRLIDANALKKTCNPDYMQTKSGKDWAKVFCSTIDNMPTIDAVEVVRCKDCIYYENCDTCLPYCNHPDEDPIDHPEENDFCKYGERKDK